MYTTSGNTPTVKSYLTYGSFHLLKAKNLGFFIDLLFTTIIHYIKIKSFHFEERLSLNA